MKSVTLLSVLTKPFSAHHELHNLLSVGILPFLAPILGSIGTGLGAAASGVGGILSGLGGVGAGLLKGGAGLLGKGLTATLGQGGLLSKLGTAGKGLYGGVDKLVGGLLPGAGSPFASGGLFSAFAPAAGAASGAAGAAGGAASAASGAAGAAGAGLPSWAATAPVGTGTVLAPSVTPSLASTIAGPKPVSFLQKTNGFLKENAPVFAALGAARNMIKDSYSTPPVQLGSTPRYAYRTPAPQPAGQGQGVLFNNFT